jgi:hypothetical protein
MSHNQAIEELYVPVGEEVSLHDLVRDVRLKAVEGEKGNCIGCYLRSANLCSRKRTICSGLSRQDKKYIIFVRVDTP